MIAGYPVFATYQSRSFQGDFDYRRALYFLLGKDQAGL
jgi:hypothetical protein